MSGGIFLPTVVLAIYVWLLWYCGWEDLGVELEERMFGFWHCWQLCLLHRMSVCELQSCWATVWLCISSSLFSCFTSRRWGVTSKTWMVSDIYLWWVIWVCWSMSCCSTWPGVSEERRVEDEGWQIRPELCDFHEVSCSSSGVIVCLLVA